MKKSLVTIVAAAAFALVGCNQVTENNSVTVRSNVAPIAAQVSVSGTSCVDLIGGQTNVIGTVCNTVVGSNLEVTVSVNEGVGLMDNVYIWAGTTWNSWPKKAKNNPSPAHAKFPYLSGPLGGATTYTHSIPLSNLGIDAETFCDSKSVYLIVHASGNGYTAFGAFSPKNIDVSGGGNWAYAYSITISGPPAPEIAFEEDEVYYYYGDDVTVTPASTGGPILSCSVSPALPDGLVLGSDCSITGVAPSVTGEITYTVTAQGQCGQSSASITIDVGAPPDPQCDPCNPPPPPPTDTCYGNHHSATGAGIKTGSNWFMTTPVDANGNASVTLFAGQTNVAGTVTISGGVVTVTVNAGWAFQPGSVINVGGFNSLPSGNLSPGQQPYALSTSGGSPVTSGVIVAGSSYVFVHANVVPEVACPVAP